MDNKIKNVKSNYKKLKTNKQLSTQEIPGEEIVIIPVVFNVIHREAMGTGKNIGSNKIDELITILNEAYSGQYGGVDTKIRFCIMGQLLYQAITDEATIEISLPNLPTGNYILKLKAENFNEIIKFIKQ